MIIDSHTHLGDFPLFNVKLNAEEMIEIMKSYKIVRSVVSALPNQLTYEAAKTFPSCINGLIWVNPHTGNMAVKDVIMAVKDWGFIGIKLHPLLHSFLPDQEIVYPIMEIAKSLDLPVLFHCGHPPWSLPWHFGNLADVFPDVTLILGHMGHGHIVYINGAIDVAKKHDNIFLETSGMPMHAKVKEAVERVGESRVLYGSDMPFGHPAFELEKVRVAGLNDYQLEAVLGLNSKRIFHRMHSSPRTD
jgi:predicted TIM-barrel fold metal-dependent hydrolase